MVSPKALSKTVLRLLLGACLVITLLLLVGCGAKSEDAKKTGDSPKPAPAAVQEDESAFFKGKTIEFLVPYGPGGGYDLYARAIAPYLAKYTGATVIVVNKPGAGGLLALNDLSMAKPDGLKISILNGTGAAQAQLTGDPAAKFDLAKFTWLSNVIVDAQVYYVTKASGYKTMEDLIKAGKVNFGATGAASNTYFNIALFGEALRPLGMDLKIVSGFNSSNETRLAMMRGDVLGTEGTYTSAAELISNNEAVAIAQLGNKRSAEIPDVPLVSELQGLDAEGKELIKIADNMMLAGRPVAAPPGISANRVKFLREAMDKVFKDAEFLKFVGTQKLAVNPQSGEEVEKTMQELLGISDSLKQKMTAAMDKYR